MSAYAGFVGADGDQCNDCGQYKQLDVEHPICEDCYTAAAELAFADGPDCDGLEPETAEERDFRLASAMLDAAHGELDAMDDGWQKDVLKKAVNEQAWTEIAEFIGADALKDTFA